MNSKGMLPLKYAKTLLNLARSRGCSIDAILRAADFEFDPFDKKFSHVKEIPSMQYSKLFQQVLTVMQDESFNLRIGHDIPNGTFRMMCYCIIHCQTLKHAIERADEFYQVIWADADDKLKSLSLDNNDQTAVMSFYLPHGNDNAVLAKTVAPGLSIWHRFCCWLIGRTIELDEVCFSGEEPEFLESYQRLFECPLVFNQKVSAFKFDVKYLSMPLVHNEESLKEFLVTAPYQLIVSREKNSVTAQIKSIIGNDFSQGFPSFNTLTQLLNTTAPTLRRRLKKEDTSYQKIKDGCRRDAAIAYLSRSELSINKVAELMGFSDPSAFHRSFKKWTGVPPGEYRHSM